MNNKILVVDDEENIRFTFENFLKDEGEHVLTAENLEEGIAHLNDDIDLIFLDILLGRQSGLDLLREVKSRGMLCPVVMITGSPELETAIEAIQLGAYDYIPKPVVHSRLIQVTNNALKHIRLLKERETFRMRLEGLFRCAQEGIIITDRKLHIVEVNDSARKMLNLESSIIGKNLDDLEDKSDFSELDGFRDIIKSRLEGEIFTLKHPDSRGQVKTLGLSASPLTTEEGGDYGFVLLLREE